MAQIRTVPDETITLRVDVSTLWEAKLAAFRCHATQLGTSPITRASRERQRAFLGMEFFVRVALKGGNDFLVGLEAK